jgi:hypothetical protein
MQIQPQIEPFEIKVEQRLTPPERLARYEATGYRSSSPLVSPLHKWIKVQDIHSIYTSLSLITMASNLCQVAISQYCNSGWQLAYYEYENNWAFRGGSEYPDWIERCTPAPMEQCYALWEEK